MTEGMLEEEVTEEDEEVMVGDWVEELSSGNGKVSCNIVVCFLWPDELARTCPFGWWWLLLSILLWTFWKALIERKISKCYNDWLGLALGLFDEMTMNTNTIDIRICSGYDNISWDCNSNLFQMRWSTSIAMVLSIQNNSSLFILKLGCTPYNIWHIGIGYYIQAVYFKFNVTV